MQTHGYNSCTPQRFGDATKAEMNHRCDMDRRTRIWDAEAHNFTNSWVVIGQLFIWFVSNITALIIIALVNSKIKLNFDLDYVEDSLFLIDLTKIDKGRDLSVETTLNAWYTFFTGRFSFNKYIYQKLKKWKNMDSCSWNIWAPSSKCLELWNCRRRVFITSLACIIHQRCWQIVRHP